jgi:hypothetical protein
MSLIENIIIINAQSVGKLKLSQALPIMQIALKQNNLRQNRLKDWEKARIILEKSKKLN